MKKLYWLPFIGVFLAILFILGANIWVINSTQDQIRDVQSITANKVALVLGTSKWTSDGGSNRFFAERMNAAAKLYRTKKISHILVSGDNSTHSYNEPRDMLQALGDLDIPEEDISLDFAGFRTLDSVVRSRAVFGQDSITIITQKFHCHRSLFIANHFGIEAIGYPADIDQNVGINMAMREVFARTFAVIDLYILKRQPKFLGEQIVLPIN